MPRLNVRARRATTDVEVTLPDGSTMLCRRRDMVTLVLEGGLPMSMLQAAQKMIELPDATPEERVKALGGENGRLLIDVLRKHAVEVALDPKVTAGETSDPNAMPVEMLSVSELMAIWTATALIPPVGAAPAAEFRSEGGGVSVVPPPSGESVPPAPEPMVTPPGVEVMVTG